MTSSSRDKSKNERLRNQKSSQQLRYKSIFADKGLNKFEMGSTISTKGMD